jgi:phosphatidylserine/phosphatidylglycerophosphate/cardiolipin synthase-like enzyme
MMEVKFARNESVAEVIIRFVRGASRSIDAAMYRVNNPRLVELLDEARARGLRVRLLVDANKYQVSPDSQELLASARIPFQRAYGRRGPGTKMHHKFVILDGRTVLTGSYNWTWESESENYESFLVLEAEQLVAAYMREFEFLWNRTAGDA